MTQSLTDGCTPLHTRESIAVRQPTDIAFHELLSVIHFVERVSTKIHGRRTVEEIFQVMAEEFAESRRYIANLMLLTDDGSSLRIVATSLLPETIQAIESVAAERFKDYRIDLSRSSVFRRVLFGGETIQAKAGEILAELVPPEQLPIVLGAMGVGDRPSIITPLTRGGKITGAFTMTSTALSAYLIPSVKTLAHHISTAMDLADESADRKRAEEILAQREQHFRSLIENAPDIIAVLNPDMTVRYSSPAAQRVHGYELEEMLGTSGFSLIHPDDVPRASEGLRLLMENPRQTISMGLRVHSKDGSWRHIELIGKNLVDDPTVKGFVVNYRDVTERKCMEEALRESEQKFRMIFTNANDGIVYLNPEGAITEVNDRVLTMFGKRREEVTGKRFYEVNFVPPEEMGRIIEWFRLTLETGEALEPTEFEIRRPGDGAVLYAETSASVIKKDGSVQGVLILVRDITHRKQIEGALRDSEARWRSLAENIPDIITTVDREGTILFANHAPAGMAKERVMGTNIVRYLCIADEREALQNAIRRVFDTGRAVSDYEIRAYGPDGSIRWYSCCIGPIQQDGRTVAVNVIAADVTGRKNSEEEVLKRNRELMALNTIAQTISESIDLDEILTNTLKKTAELLHIRHGAFLILRRGALFTRIQEGRMPDWGTLIPRGHNGESLTHLALRSGEPFFIESLEDSLESPPPEAVRIILEERLKSAMFVPLKARRDVLGIMCAATQDERVFTPEERELLKTIGHQVSTAIENAQLLEDASRAEALEELDKLRTALLASVSHELRTPLTAIKGIASSLTQPDIVWDAETQQDFLTTIERESDILTRIVEDLMKMSQIEAGLLTLEKKRSRVSSIVSQLHNQLRTLAKNHQIEVKVSRRLPAVYVDEVRIGEVITNLVGNAAAYSDPGTRILLEARRLPGEIVISVSDEGIGIPEEHLEKVFDRFYRLESGVARRRGGTGLGLAICKGIVEQHGGRIWAESTVGKASKFSFSLPIMENLEG